MDGLGAVRARLGIGQIGADHDTGLPACRQEAQLRMDLVLYQLGLRMVVAPEIVLGQIDHIAFHERIRGHDFGGETGAHEYASINSGKVSAARRGARP